MKVVIIGNGISGITAARTLRKYSDCEIHVISSESKYFFSRTALMYIYMGHMRFQDTKPYEDFFWEKNNINLIHDHVTSIDFNNNLLFMKLRKSCPYDKLILALGSKPNKFGWPGQDLKGVGGLYHFQDLEQMEAYSPGLQRAVIVGGGLIGIEMAEMFNSRKIPVTLLVREKNYWDNVLPKEEAKLISQHIKDHHIDLRLGVNLDRIVDDGKGNVCKVVVKETQEEISCGYVGLTAGVRPNVEWLEHTDLHMNRGILVDEYLQSNIRDVYAIGDCAQLSDPPQGRRAIEAVWYTGRMMGETVAHNILGASKKYDPGIWFNSAKFLDIEYQVYGDIPPSLPDDTGTIYWESDDHTKSIRINYDKSTQCVLGFNLLGIRFRHEVCEQWIRDKTGIIEVLSNISLAFFDPEFYSSYSESLIQKANAELYTQISPPEKKSWDKVFTFLSR
jgi:NAD(P)H-nitrite reductase large subunit